MDELNFDLTKFYESLRPELQGPWRVEEESPAGTLFPESAPPVFRVVAIGVPADRAVVVSGVNNRALAELIARLPDICDPAFRGVSRVEPRPFTNVGAAS